MYADKHVIYGVVPINNEARICTQTMTIMQDDNDDDNATASLHILSWPLGQISQQKTTNMAGKMGIKVTVTYYL